MFNFVIALVVTSLVFTQAAYIKMPVDEGLIERRTDWGRGAYSNADELHEVVFAVRQNNLDILEKTLWEVSDPKSPKYAQYLNRQQIADLTAHAASTEIVLNYLKTNGVSSVTKTTYGEYITAKASIQVWEKLFATTFFRFNHVEGSEKSVSRANHYSLESEISEHVTAVFNTVQLPPQMNGKPLYTRKALGAQAGSTITPAVLNSYYNITSNTGNNLASQAVFETIGQYYSPADLAQFEAAYNVPTGTVITDIGGFVSDAQCVSNANNCVEANLDVQYLIAVSNVTPTTYWYEAATDSFLAWIKAVSADPNPPLVHSISYGSTESALPKAMCTQFSTEAQKLGVQGVSIMVSSGDDGVAGSGARSNPRNCGYSPSFPATCPYITAVGATQGAEKGGPEISCSASTGGVVTTGGGFSTQYAAPAYQTATIANYFSGLSAAQQPAAGYVTTGRAYPDLSGAGYNYEVVVGGNTYQVSGTSASSPVPAGFVSLVNAALLAAGKKSVGFINTALYQSNGAPWATDITVGENNCAASAVCCSEGFYATAGWDPATGFGSVNFANFKTYFMSLQ